jgi:hypothetical protein
MVVEMKKGSLQQHTVVEGNGLNCTIIMVEMKRISTTTMVEGK